MFSTMRESAARTVARQVLAAPSCSSSAKQELRASHISLGFVLSKENEGRSRISETKQSYIKQPDPGLVSAAENKARLRALQASNIDLAAGEEKCGRHWRTDQSESLAANMEDKFQDQRPLPADGSKNYRSQVEIGFSPSKNRFETESKCQYAVPENPEPTVGYAATLGKELQAHSWDHAEHQAKTTSQWHSAQTDEMSRKAIEKFSCRPPPAFDELKRHLRASSLYLGKDEVDFTVGGRRQEEGVHPSVHRKLSMPQLGHGIYRP
jgi:hypothetical protein